MIWNEISLGEVFKIRHGYAFKSAYFANEGRYVVLTPGNFHEEGGFKDQPGKDRYYTGDIPERFILEKGDLLVVMTEQMQGLLGSPGFIPSGDRYLHNQRLGLVTDLDYEKIDKIFLYYLFNIHEVRHQISASASGTKVRHTAPERIYRVRIRVPQLAARRRIGAILCAYDDLIENNLRRIVLLEKAARSIYDEWFVRLRFPGYEHTRIVDGVPEGWERVQFQEALFLQRGFDITKAEQTEGEIPVVSSSGIKSFHSEAKVSGPGVVIGRKGSLGTVHYLDGAYWPHDTTLWVKEFKKVTPLLASFLLQEMHLGQYDVGVSVPTLNRNAVHRVIVRIPPRNLVSRFDEEVNQIFMQIATLRLLNEKLKQARDLLLPRLMNGEIAV